MPLSEALAARHHAKRPWWRRAAQSIEHRFPAALHGRWALSLPAATAVALVAVVGAAVGGWYLTRSQATVVDVAGTSAEAASTTRPPGEERATSGSADSGESAAQARGRSSTAVAGRDGACRAHTWPSSTPQELPATPTAWVADTAHGVPMAAPPATKPVRPSSSPTDGFAPNDVRIPPGITAAILTLPRTAIGAWHPAPITRRSTIVRAAGHQSCPSRSAVSTAPALAGPASAGTVIVDVEGKVARPGVETLPAGSRVYEALAAAGGALPGVDVTALDLARPVTDGEQLRVGIAGAPSPVVGLPQPASGVPRGKRAKSGQPVNLNTATLEQLETVPDVGPSLAQRILDWRAEHGRFESVAQLRQVRGIGERKFADMRDAVTV
jgi:competence protein ComEA